MPASSPARVLAIVGATATGKTAVGEWVAERLDAEIVCADSRQVYRELAAGTGKPAPDELAARPHWLFDARAVGERASAGWYARAAAEACAAILARGHLPLLVGGSGLYLEALQSGLSPEPPHDAALRERLAEEAKSSGTPALHARLSALDPEAAARLGPADTQRVVRALEIVIASGRPTAWWRRQPSVTELDARWTVVELQVPARDLGPRIEARTRAMFDGGLPEEVRGLVAAGREPGLQALSAVGYDEALDLVHGRIDRATAEARTNARTRQLAKRQRTWFRHRLLGVRLDAASAGAAALGAAVLGAHARAGSRG